MSAIPTHVEENYLKAIFSLSLKHPDGASTNDIARRLEATAPSVSDMLRKLKAKGWIEYQKYQGARLSTRGRELAVEVVRRHRLWEVFLVEKLNFSWDEVHDLAEQLEHIRSGELTNRLDAFLDFPRVDPHGDPIPDAAGNIQFDATAVPLHLADQGARYELVGVKDTSTSFLRYLDHTGLSLGSHIQLMDRLEFDQSVLIELHDKSLHMSPYASKNILVKPLPHE